MSILNPQYKTYFRFVNVLRPLFIAILIFGRNSFMTRKEVCVWFEYGKYYCHLVVESKSQS